MSDDLRYSLRFPLRRDTPSALITALQALAARGNATVAETAGLPPMVARYFQAGDFFGEAEPGPPTTRIEPLRARGGPDEPIWRLHYDRQMRDDEYWNGGMYLIYWLLSFAAYDGMVGQMVSQTDYLQIIHKQGVHLVETNMAQTSSVPEPFSVGLLDGPPVLQVRQTNWLHLADYLTSISDFSE